MLIGISASTFAAFDLIILTAVRVTPIKHFSLHIFLVKPPPPPRLFPIYAEENAVFPLHFEPLLILGYHFPIFIFLHLPWHVLCHSDITSGYQLFLDACSFNSFRLISSQSFHDHTFKCIHQSVSISP